MYKIVKKVNGVEVYKMKVESLVSRSERYWYNNVCTKGLPSIREINDKVNLDEKFSFETLDSVGYSVHIQIEKEG